MAVFRKGTLESHFLSRKRIHFPCGRMERTMLLGIDVGTGGARAVLVDRRGVVVASAASEHAAIRSEHIGWAEQEPEDWWRAAREAISGAMAAANLTGAEIQAIGLTGQMHGCVMRSEERRVGKECRSR